MNTQQENIIVDSCQYTPVYLVQNTGAIQGRPYIVTQANIEEPKPVSDNLKRFYERSGILENNYVQNSPTISKPRILKKQDSQRIGNNLKLASFLLPKTSQENNLSKQCLPVNNVVLKQVVSGNVLNSVPKMEVVSANIVNTAPKVEIASSSVAHNPPQVELVTTNVMNSPSNVELISTNVMNNASQVELIKTNVMSNVPKVELMTANIVNNKSPQVELVTANVNNGTKVELVTTNVLNCNAVPKVEVDRKIVKLNNFPNALRTSPRYNKPKMKPRDDIPLFSTPNPNQTKHTSVQLLKLGETYHSLNQLSEDQMKMVNQALKIFSNPEKPSTEPTYDPVTNTKFIYKVVSPRDLTVVGKNKLKKEEPIIVTKKEPKKVIIEESKLPEPIMKEIKITRSGRKVKFPKQIVQDLQQKPKKKHGSVVSCLQCSTEFCSLYRLQRHYDSHPTHIPAKVHSNLYHCLLAIIKSGSEENRTKIFIQQLEQLIEKLRSLLPCLMKKIDGTVGKPCTINDDIGRLFGMAPGEYKLNMDALTCVKNKDGNCRHNPAPKTQFNPDINTPSQIWLSKHNEEITSTEQIAEDCARINAVDKWPTANKRIRNSKQQKSIKSENKAKKMRMTSENSEALIDLEDLVNFNTPKNQTAMTLHSESLSVLDNLDLGSESCIQPLVSETINEQSTINEQLNDLNGTSVQFDLNSPNNESAISMQPKSLTSLDNLDLISDSCIHPPVACENQITIEGPPKKPKGAHTQFHSAHFDIRSSPIKSSSAATFRKFQINPEKLAKYEVQILKPIDLDTPKMESEPRESVLQQQPETVEDPEDLHSIFRDDIIALTCKDPNDIPNDLAFEATKDWICDGLNAIEKSDDNFMKTNSLDESYIKSSLIEPALLHLKEDSVDKLCNNPINSDLILTENDDNRLTASQSSSVLNFLESLGSECLSYPETEIRNTAVDFQLDLFSFSNT